jgi:hypothetical protein
MSQVLEFRTIRVRYLTFILCVNFILCIDIFHSDVQYNQCTDMKWVAWYQPAHNGQGPPLLQKKYRMKG